MQVAVENRGRVGFLTSEQQGALELLKIQLQSENQFKEDRHDDYLLLRFLRARRFDVTKSKTMLLDCEKWRQSFGVDELVRSFDFPELDDVKKYYPQYYHSTDKVGRPIYIEHLGKLDLKQLLNVTTMERMHQKHVYEYEVLINYRMPACEKKAGVHIEQSCTILDLKGVSLWAFGQVASFVKQISSIAQDYYPEMLGKMFIINAPMLFSGVWSVVKPLLDEVTVSKIMILGSSYQSTLLEYIDKENLPEALGGSCKCPEGCENSDKGPWTDPLYAVDWAPLKERRSKSLKP